MDMAHQQRRAIWTSIGREEPKLYNWRGVQRHPGIIFTIVCALVAALNWGFVLAFGWLVSAEIYWVSLGCVIACVLVSGFFLIYPDALVALWKKKQPVQYIWVIAPFESVLAMLCVINAICLAIMVPPAP
jgi:hypothetical protein